MDGCSVCAKHRALDEILGDEHAVVSHLVPEGEPVYLGYLFVEPRRHVAGLGELTPAEAASFGRLAADAAGALRRGEGAEHVYAAVIGHGVDHLHLHLIARYPGTPREYWWVRVDEWPDAPRGDAAAVAAVSARLRGAAARTG
jgi:diadenosine tetraphosphate (Ap4A) HIT family hydrolase